MGDGGRGDAELLGGMGEAPVPGGGFEEAQAVKGRQGFHGFGRVERSEIAEISPNRLMNKFNYLTAPLVTFTQSETTSWQPPHMIRHEPRTETGLVNSPQLGKPLRRRRQRTTVGYAHLVAAVKWVGGLIA